MSAPTPFRRGASVQKISSPDQIDRLLAVTRPMGWLALLGCAVLVAATVVWGLIGTIRVTVAGQGILVRSGGIYEVTVGNSGRLVDMAVAVGEQIRQGQVVARVAQPDLVDKLTQARLVVRNREASHQQVQADSSRTVDLQLRVFDQQAGHLEQSIAAARDNVKWFDDKIATQRELVQEGRLTKQTLINTVQQFDELKERLRRLSDEIGDLAIKRQQVRAEQERRLQDSRAELTVAEADLATLERRISAAGDVISGHTGRVIEVMTEPGDIVTAGEPLFSLDLTGRTVSDLQAVVYVSSQEGKRLQPGMAVQIAPSVVRPEEFGHLLGRVTYVSDFPTTSRGMQRVLKNERLVKAISGDNPLHEVHADLVRDLATSSGYRWSSSMGPNMKMQSGTLCSAEITVEHRRPIELVVPFLRRAGGF